MPALKSFHLPRLSQNFIATVRRFPLSVACSVLLFGYSLSVSDPSLFMFDDDNKAFWGRLLVIGFFWFGIARLYKERHAVSDLAHYITAILTYAVIAGFSYWAHHTGNNFFIWPILGSLFLSLMVAPFINRRVNDDSEFWTYNHALWLGVLQAFLLALIVFLGLLFAESITRFLFSAPGSSGGHHYFFSLSAYLFAFLCALMAVPAYFSVRDIQFERASKILINVILVPFSWVYLAIIMAYAAKILLEWNLPIGGLAGIVAACGAVCIVTFMAGWFLRDDGPVLTRLFMRHFPKLMIVPLGLMAVALIVRVADYGFTINRYMVAVMFVWLMCVTLGLLFLKQFRLKFIPMILAVLLVVSAFGPVGAWSITGYSQSAILRTLLIKNHILVDEKIVPAQAVISLEDHKKIDDIVRYAVHQKRLDILPPELRIYPSKGTSNRDEKIMQLMGLGRYYQRAKGQRYGEGAVVESVSFQTWLYDDRSLDVAGYDRIYKVEIYERENGKKRPVRELSLFGEKDLKISLEESFAVVSRVGRQDVRIDLRPLWREGMKRKSLPKEERKIPAPEIVRDEQGLRVKIVPGTMHGWFRDQEIHILNADLWLLVGDR